MSDYFSFKPICKKCGFDLSGDNEMGFGFMMPVGKTVDLTCPKCGTVWRFWFELSARQKKINTKKNRKVAKTTKI